MGRNIHLVLSWTRNLYGKNEVSAEIIVWYAMDSNKKKLLDRIADIRMIHEMSSAQNALDHLKDYCSNSWTTKPRVQCRLFNRVLKRWTAQLISVILFRWIVIYPVDSAIQPGGGGTSLSEASWDVRWMGSHFHDWIDYNAWGRIFNRVHKNGVAHFRILGLRKLFIFTVSKRTRILVL